MRFFRKLAGFLVLICLVPALALLAAASLARWAECGLDPETPLKCPALGGDYGDILYSIEHFGYYAVATLPMAAALLISWIAIEIAFGLGRGKPAQPQTPASSRNFERGS